MLGQIVKSNMNRFIKILRLICGVFKTLETISFSGTWTERAHLVQSSSGESSVLFREKRNGNFMGSACLVNLRNVIKWRVLWQWLAHL